MTHPNKVAADLVLVEWVDSHAGRGWQTVDRIAGAARPLYCRSVGWLLAQTKDCIVIVPHIGGERNGDVMQQGSGDLVVPTQAIIKMATLRRT